MADPNRTDHVWQNLGLGETETPPLLQENQALPDPVFAHHP